MKATPARRKFKSTFGQANHLLITALVGLEQLDGTTPLTSPNTFTASWNPRDVKSSVSRSRVFLLKSFLGWAVESLEMYLTEIYRKPKAIDQDRFESIYSSAGQSVFYKATYVGKEAGVDALLVAMVEVLVAWRNQTFHHDVGKHISVECEEVLRNNVGRIRSEFCGLDIDPLIKSIKKNNDLTFKETAALIRATQQYVEDLDSILIEDLDAEIFAAETTKHFFSSSERALRKFRSLPRHKQLRYIESVIRERCGLSEVDDQLVNDIGQDMGLNKSG